MQKAKFRDIYANYCKDHFDVKSIDQLNDHQRSLGLALCYFMEVFSKTSPGLFPEDADELLSYWVDGSNDQGCDLFFPSDGHNYIIQCKFHGKSKTEDKHEVCSFKDIIRRLHPELGGEFNKNNSLLDLLSDVDWKNDTFHLIYICLGKANSDIREIEKQEFHSVENTDLSDIDDRASFRFLDESDLNMEYRDSITSQQMPTVAISPIPSKDGSANWYLYKTEEGHKSYITSISANQIFEHNKNHRQKLYNLNIRNFIGETQTNKGVKATAQTEPENFFFYNNGVSAIASEITIGGDGKQLKCKNFSVINGAQTFQSVAKVYMRANEKEKKELQKVAVMIRITETPELFSKPEFVENITRFNNTQNVVKLSDFRSNHGVQICLSNYFSKISFAGKNIIIRTNEQKIILQIP